MPTPAPAPQLTSRTCCIELVEANPSPQIATEQAISG